MTCAFSCFPGLGRVTVRAERGGSENGRPVDGEAPADGQLDKGETGDRVVVYHQHRDKGSHRLAMRVYGCTKVDIPLGEIASLPVACWGCVAQLIEGRAR